MFSTPAVVGDVVCVGSCAGIFYALDRATGRPRGQHEVSGADSVHRQFHGDALLDRSLVLIGTDTGEGDTAYVFAFEPGTANVRWRQPMGPGVMGDIARWRDWRYVVTGMDELVCFDSASGATRWSHRPEGSVYNDRTSSPIVVENRIVYADRHGAVWAVDAGTGRRLWRSPQLDPLTTWPLEAGSSVMFMRGADALIRLDPATGRERKHTIVGGGPYSGPMAALGDSLLLLLGSRTLTALDLPQDRIRWSHAAAEEWTSSRPYVWRDMVLAGDRGHLIAYGLDDGRVRWRHTLPGVIRGIGTYGDTLYVGTLKGRVHALVDHAEGGAGQP